MELLEQALANVSLFEHLRADEIGRIARRFERFDLAPGEARSFGGSAAEQRLVVVVKGRVRLETALGGHAARAILDPGDRFGDRSLIADHLRPFRVVAQRPSSLASIDRARFELVLEEFPAVGLPLADELSRELRAQNDAVRQLLELHAARLPDDELESAVAERSRALRRQRSGVTRLSPRAIFRRLVVQPEADPPFWMLAGFLVALCLARLVVFLILQYHLEAQLFALVQGTDPNPMHVHHFNYGLILVGSSGLAALFPMGRRALRVLAFTFGSGCGLIFDEFSLIWNLNPEYGRPSSMIASGIAATLLVQLTYFRRYWLALARRAWRGLRGWR
jgi:CRP-like cAMP-binding protein